jgi:hypothetical protein
MTEPNWDDVLARETARYMDGPAWEGRPVQIYRQPGDWMGLGPCELTVDVEAGSAEGWVSEAVSDEGDDLSAKLNALLPDQRWVKLTTAECAEAQR